MRFATWCVLSGLLGCTSAWNAGPGPYSAAEVDRTLAPVRALEARCYAGSISETERRRVRLSFILYIDERGAVRSDPVEADVRDPDLTECMRTGLDALRFEPKNASDQLRVSFELGTTTTAAAKE